MIDERALDSPEGEVGRPGIGPDLGCQLADQPQLAMDCGEALDIVGLFENRSDAARNTRRKKNIGAPIAAKSKNQFDLPNSARISTR